MTKKRKAGQLEIKLKEKNFATAVSYGARNTLTVSHSQTTFGVRDDEVSGSHLVWAGEVSVTKALAENRGSSTKRGLASITTGG